MPTPTKRASRRGTTELKASHFDINDRVKLIRLSRKLTQPQFSQLTGLTVSYIKAIERYAYTPTVSALKLIHDTCEVTYDWLIDGNK